MEEQPPEVLEVEEEEDVIEEDADRLLDDDGDEEDNEGSVQRLCALMSNTLFLGFDAHVKALEHARARRREALAFKSAVEEDVAVVDEGAAKKTQDELDGLGVWMPGDVYRGDVNMRTLQKLLARVDARGFERSAQQLEFHQAFMKAAARVIYKGEWETERPMIMEKYGWERCNSEVLISTPRRFGKTYRFLRTYLTTPPLAAFARAIPSRIASLRRFFTSGSDHNVVIWSFNCFFLFGAFCETFCTLDSFSLWPGFSHSFLAAMLAFNFTSGVFLDLANASACFL